MQRKSKKPALRLTRDEIVRYSRHLVIPEIGMSGQRKLKASSALVVGAGGLGTPAAVYLAAAGVGKIGVVDSDEVEKSNLQRQFLFSESDVGLNKAAAMKSGLMNVNPNVDVEAFQLRLDSSNAMRILKRYDVVLDCTDNLPSRYLINDACVLLGKPDVYASALKFDGQATVFHPPTGPCYRCLYPEPPPPEAVESCEEAGVLGVLPGILGGVQALQATSLLLGRVPPLSGRLLVIGGLESSFEEVRIKRNLACPVCGSKPTIRKLIDYDEFCGMSGPTAGRGLEISPLQLDRMLKRGEHPLLLDVREPYEHKLCSLKGSELIPLRELRARMGELERDRDIVVYCHHGNRSARAVKLLRSVGRNALNLKGGIEAWAESVDPAMPRY